MGSELAVGTVLVVDDNAENRALAKATLDDENIRCVLASSGAEGIAAFVRERPDCVLLDIRMPGTDGIAVCERIRSTPGGADTAILFLTAQRDVDTFDRALRAGGDDFITKPFRPSELIVRLHTALRLRKIAAERGALAVELKHQRDVLQRLQLQKEQLSAFLVHDLKNPVSTIALQAQRVLRNPNDIERARDAAAKIHDETTSLMRMITNLLDIGKADEGQLAPARRGVDTRVLVDGVLDELRIRASTGGVQLVASITSPSVDVDPDVMHRVLANLVDNAIRHAPAGSSVTVAVARCDGGVELRVTDTGPGVPSEIREHVFERFVSARSGTANRGLGLAFCKVAVEAHGGEIWIEDTRPGAAFCIRIHDS